MQGEVVSMTMGAYNTLVCGMINGMIGLIDVGSALEVKQIYHGTHTGTVISCAALASTQGQFIVSQDDSREIKVWNINDFNTPLIKTYGRSYNPVWFVQSLIEITGSGDLPHILSTCGNEPKIINYKIDLLKKELI